MSIDPRAPRRAPGSENGAGSARIRINSDLVLIPVLVTDKQDRIIMGLGREHFRLWDEKAEQVISHFATEDAPVSIGLVFDASGSMRNKLSRSRAAVAEFVRSANPQDEFFLVQFNDRAQLMQGFTDQIEDIQNRMMFIEPKGNTALLDAVILSLNQMKNAKHRRKALLIISDGGDNNSRYSQREVKARLRESDVQVYSIGIMEPAWARSLSLEELGGPALLDGIAKLTGGRLFQADDLGALAGIATKISTALRTQYVLGYSPGTEMRDGKYHRVQVKIDLPKGAPPLRASFRAGYYASEN